MANFQVTVEGMDTQASVVVAGIPQATSLAAAFLLKGQRVFVAPTDKGVTHKNTYSAQAFIEVGQMNLDLHIFPRTLVCQQ